MAQKKLETRPCDAPEHLETEEDVVVDFDAALDDGDAALVVAENVKHPTSQHDLNTEQD